MNLFRWKILYLKGLYVDAKHNSCTCYNDSNRYISSSKLISSTGKSPVSTLPGRTNKPYPCRHSKYLSPWTLHVGITGEFVVEAKEAQNSRSIVLPDWLVVLDPDPGAWGKLRLADESYRAAFVETRFG